MKFLIYAMVFTLAFIMGGASASLYLKYDFGEITGVKWDQFMSAKKDCERRAHTECGIYGGYAPKAQIEVKP